MGFLMLNPSRGFVRYIAAAVAVVFFLIVVVQIRVQQIGYGLPVQATSWPPLSTSAADDIFDFPPIESEAIKSVCAATAWDTRTAMEVVFTCENSVGGVGNIRNSVLNCVRYAMLAGGSLVMPKIVARDDSDINVIRTGERRGLGYMFDVEHFVESLRLSCPQLRLYNNTDAVFKALGQPKTFTMGLFPELLVDKNGAPNTGITHPELWKGKLYEWLGQVDTKLGPTGQPTRGPFIVELGRSYMTFPIYSDGDGFATSFGDILKFRADTRQLATTTLRRMAEQFNFESALPKPVSAANITPPESPVLKNAYFGAHLRVERDAMINWSPTMEMWAWSDYGKQTTAYMEQAMNANLSLIYVASGETAHVETFKTEAATKGITVIKKQDVLGEDIEKLDRLAWDQQALVDYLVMLKASQFGGVAHSSFAWNVALKRHILVRDPKKSYLDGPQMLSDEFSQVYGEPRKYPEYALCLWP
ncbi:hypothetical protein ColTof4_08127 [Colletotrichum tofieldiae]|uniref:Alternative oxidase n=1 Tax=Colletotrichum tofieldiae TaxID=708197 RepID=A0A166UM20_9PEZI|nr:hypothetical protein CT0861_03464 [Colletotrichum tofieldiae]GKT55012.1 hypothetical protein ColTof3_02351 [Colletotrichum tofieldiae]GKT75704.1 hypothetical protein ColTof4_08127 [Colletotrichum tofieldiae]GKT83398.1 hypothetical protein Ct61P_01248 [Colletotrichum tofieldiae]